MGGGGRGEGGRKKAQEGGGEGAYDIYLTKRIVLLHASLATSKVFALSSRKKYSRIVQKYWTAHFPTVFFVSIFQMRPLGQRHPITSYVLKT